DLRAVTSNVKKGPWTPEEDAKILAHVASHGIGNWTLVPQKAGLNRCGKSCRLRWTNYLRPESPDLKHDSFTPEEEEHIVNLHKAIGSRWSLIAKRLPGRTDNDVKNHWNTKLRKKLTKMGIDPITHKPLPQVLSDYGNISGLPNTRNQFVSLIINSNISMSQSEQSSVSRETQLFHNFPFMTNNQAWDTMAHLQMANQETIQPHFFNEVSSSSTSSSSSSCQASHHQMIPSSPSDFLVEDPLLSEKDCEFQGIEKSRSNFSSENGYDSNEFKHENKADATCKYGSETQKFSEATTSAGENSFIETILHKENQMQLEFPQFLDDYYV
ncbi:hypothetical protein RJ639_024964, partial [Escallonia herrerae]